MIGIRYVDELFAIISVPREFWRLIRKDLRYDGNLEKIEGFFIFFLLPILAIYPVYSLKIAFGSRFYSLLIPTATLFVGFSMNSVLLLLRYSNKDDASPLLVDQTRNMITYLLYLGVVIAGIGVAGYIADTQITENISSGSYIFLANNLISIASVFTLTHFLIVVLFLPARIFTIIENTSN